MGGWSINRVGNGSLFEQQEPCVHRATTPTGVRRLGLGQKPTIVVFATPSFVRTNGFLYEIVRSCVNHSCQYVRESIKSELVYSVMAFILRYTEKEVKRFVPVSL